VLLIDDPGTIEDMVADAAERGYKATARLIRDWTAQGLLDYPQRRPAGKGRGSVPALYPASQRNLLITLLHHRPRNHIRSLARIPVGIWLHWGEEYVTLRQARRAFMTWLGDPRVSKQAAAEAARAILGQIDSPRATPRARRELLAAITDANYTGRPDFPRIEQAARDVFEPGASRIRRAIGHPAAPVMAESMIAVNRARINAVGALTGGQVTDEMFLQAREAYLFGYAEYAANQPRYAAQAPAGQPQLYEPVTVESTLNQCCGHLLTTIGLEITYPSAAEELRKARASMRTPKVAAFGLGAPIDPAP
jgi:hypothetical protein